MARKKKQPTEEPQENLDNTDDTFGLPDVEYQPLKRDEPANTEETAEPEEPKPQEKVVIINESPVDTPEPPTPEDPATQFRESEPVEPEPVHEDKHEGKRTYEAEHQSYQPSYTYKEETPAVWPKVLGVIVVLALIGGAVWYFASYRPKQLAAKQEQERRETLAAQELARKKEDERLAAKRAEEEKNAAALVPPKPAIGTIETLSGRSGRYYVVVASAIDGLQGGFDLFAHRVDGFQIGPEHLHADIGPHTGGKQFDAIDDRLRENVAPTGHLQHTAHFVIDQVAFRPRLPRPEENVIGKHRI